MTLLLQQPITLALETRKKNQIANTIDPGECVEGERLLIEQYKKQFHKATYRDFVGPCITYNCHGLTFASRRTCINTPSEVQKTLDEDGYKKIEMKENILLLILVKV